MSRNVVCSSIRNAEHFRQAWLACAHSANGGGAQLSLQMVEEMVMKYGMLVGRAESRQQREVGSHQSETDTIQAMLNEHTGATLVKFKPSQAEPAVDFVWNGVIE